MNIVRTATAVQHDTLDAIAYRYFGQQSSRYLPLIIELNSAFTPYALIPRGTVIVLPQLPPASVKPAIKLWD